MENKKIVVVQIRKKEFTTRKDSCGSWDDDLKLDINTSGQIFDWENNKVYIFNAGQKNSVKMSIDVYFKYFSYNGKKY